MTHSRQSVILNRIDSMTCLEKFALFGLALQLAACVLVSGEGLPPICCFPDQWEGYVMGDSGLVDVQSNYGYGYTNATIKAVYDYTNNRTYMREDSITYMSLFPGYPIILRDIYIMDYTNNVQYHVYNDSTCDKGVIDEALFKQCVPGNATKFDRGTLGGEGSPLKVESFLFRDRIYLDPYQVTVTLSRTGQSGQECVPVHLTTSQAYVFDDPKNVDISAATVTDFVPRITDPSVFTPPPNCTSPPLKTKDELKKSTLAAHLFKIMERR